MDYPVDAMCDDCFLETFEVQNVGENVGTLIDDLLAWLDDV